MKVRKKIYVSAAAITLLMLSGCGQKVYEYSAEDYVYISVSGLDGKGQASVKFDRDGFYELLNRDLYSGKATEEELAAMEVILYDQVDIVIDGDKEDLSNGDTLSITLLADNEKLSGYGINFSDKSFVYTVSGLEEAQEIDIFEGVSVEYEYYSPFAKAAIVNDGSYSDHVKYSIDLDEMNNIANGDTLTIKASIFDKDYFEENNLVPASLEKQITVEGLEYLADSSELDYSEIDKLFQSKMDETMTDGNTYTKGWESDARAFFKDGQWNEYWVVDSCEYKPVKKGILMIDRDTWYQTEANIYNLFWELTMDIEKKNSGDKDTVKIYACAYITDVTVKDDGTVFFDPDKYGLITYSTSLFGNYVGCTLDEVFEVRKNNTVFGSDVKWIEVE